MCHGHVDLRTIEREVRDRVRAVKPGTMPAAARSDEASPGLRALAWLRRFFSPPPRLVPVAVPVARPGEARIGEALPIRSASLPSSHDRY